MAVRTLDLYDLLAPQFALGFSFPDYIDAVLGEFRVHDLVVAYDEDLVVYSGRMTVGSGGSFVQQQPGGTTLSWNGNDFRFRLSVSRDATNQINDLVNPASSPPAAGSVMAGVVDLLQDLRPASAPDADRSIAHPHPADGRNAVVTDYPGFAFQLELLVDILNFSLGSNWVAGKIDTASHRVVPDADPRYANKPVRVVLPQAVLEYRQGSDLGRDVEVNIRSWGGSGLDTPHDLEVGTFVRMEPAIALHRSGDFAFSVDQIILDLSEDTTPSEILQHFGTAEDFRGLYFGSMLVYYANDQGVGFNLRVRDALISFAGEVSLEGALDVFLMKGLTRLSVTTRLYTGRVAQSFVSGEIDLPDAPPRVTDPVQPPGRATLAVDSVLQLEISGGTPPYRIQVFQGTTNIWDQATRQAIFRTPGSDLPVLIVVRDSRPGEPRAYAEYLAVTVQATVNPVAPGGTGTALDRPADVGRPAAELTPGAGFDGRHGITHTPSDSGLTETISLVGERPATLRIVRGGGLPAIEETLDASRRSVSLEVVPGADYTIEVAYPGTPVSELSPLEVSFIVDAPETPAQLSNYLADAGALSVHPNGTSVQLPPAPVSRDPQFIAELSRLNEWVPHIASVTALRVDGFASYRSGNLEHDETLSQHRAQVGRAVAEELGISPSLITTEAHSNEDYLSPGGENGSQRRFQCFRLTPAIEAEAAHSLSATISRPALPAEDPAVPGSPSTTTQPPVAPPAPNEVPTVLRRLGFRVRIERNELVLLELNGELDFQTAMEDRLRASGENPSDLRLVNGGGHEGDEDGVVDFRVIYTYNSATSEYGVSLGLGADPDDPDGLLHVENGTGPASQPLPNIFGALMLFAPLINEAAEHTAENSDDAGAWIGLGVSLAVPIAVGATGIIRTRRVVLYGGELMVKFSEPGAPGPNSWQLGILFDYGVEFDLVVPSLGIGADRNVANATTPPLKVRYRGIGFALHHNSVTGGLDYSPIFDSSKGYDLQLSDPSLFSLPAPLGNLFGVTAARLARFNPLTLEVDLAIKADLGVITVDKFKIKIPLDGDGNVQIMPSGVKVNIPGTLIGNGFVNIIDGKVAQTDGTEVDAKGIEGGLDLTIVSVKLRVAGNVGVTSLSDPASGREGVGVYVGLRVEFPSPIVLGASGLGLYGLTGLFAMHYRRLETEAPAPANPVGPALQWLIDAKGDPTKLREGDKVLWTPEFDRWAFGVGVILGTLDTGFTANFQGMFILELPGPRILIMVKMKFVSVKPKSVDSDVAEITTGILAVIDIDFNQQKITIGVMIDFEIEEVLKLQVPVEILFKLDDPSYWHFWLGTHTVPVSAEILKIVRGSAYFMIQGHDLTFPDHLPYVPKEEPPQGRTLQGVAIALGLEASLVFGSKPARLYLEIGAGFHVGLSFSPFMLVGSMFFRGELMLFIVSIGASGTLSVEISRKGDDPYYIYLHGEVCGSISFFFFSVSACIGITIEEGNPGIEAPDLINGVYLQSYAPVLLSGQGGSRPIDASLGNAVPGRDTAELPVVPIDSVPVIQFYASPLTGELDSFTEHPGASPELSDGGWIILTEETQIRYDLKEIILEESGGSPYTDLNAVPATWRVDTSGDGITNGGHRNIDLALFSRVPTTAPRALERSGSLRKRVEVDWENLCKEPAPPAPVLFTFCNKPIGPSPSGWTLRGTAKPDPAGTLRRDSPSLSLRVTEPYGARDPWEDLVGEVGGSRTIPARVIGVTLPASVLEALGNRDAQSNTDYGTPVCTDFTKRPLSAQLNLSREGLFVARDRSLTRLRTNVFKPLDLGQLSTTERLAAILANPGARITLPGGIRIGRDLPDLAAGANGDDNLDLTSARVVAFGNTRGVAIGKVGLQFKSPVCRVEVRLLAGAAPAGAVVFTAYDATGREVDTQIERFPKGAKALTRTVVLEAPGITTVTLNAKGVEGVITRVCHYTNCRSAVPFPELDCMRALQMGYAERRAQRVVNDPELQARIDQYEAEADRGNYLDVHTGSCTYIRGYLAVYSKFMSRLTVLELDRNGEVLAEHALRDLIVANISTAADFPADWIDDDLPWLPKVIAATLPLATGERATYGKHIFYLEPRHPQECVTLRFDLSRAGGNMPAVYLAALERLELAEAGRQATIGLILDGKRKTLEGYLSHGETDRPLLLPGKIYHLRVKYQVTIRTGMDGEEDEPGQEVTQEFSFRTDDAPPTELSPYVIATTPQLDEEYHFFEDPLRVIFNDRGSLEMYENYGVRLHGVIRKADGGPVTGSPDDALPLEDVAATLLTPYREFVEELIASGRFPCTGGFELENNHALYTAPFTLQPLMAYTFDVEMTPAPAAENGRLVPPLRRAFRTSRYADVANFAASLSGLPVHSVALIRPLTVPASTTRWPDRADVSVVADRELEDMLISAGLPPVSGTRTAAISLLWVPDAGGFRPAAVLIDADEPLWRMRSTPTRVTVTDGAEQIPDPDFQLWQTGEEVSLQLYESAARGLVSRFLHANGGTRCLVLLNPARLTPTVQSLTLDLQRPVSALYDLPESRHPMITVSLTPNAPWED